MVLAFLSLVYDGARTIADQTLRLTRLGELWNDINQASQLAFQKAVEGLSPFWEFLESHCCCCVGQASR